MKKPRLPLPLITAITAGWLLSGCHKLASFEESYAVSGSAVTCEGVTFYPIPDHLAAQMERLYEEERLGKTKDHTFYHACGQAHLPLQAWIKRADFSEDRFAVRLPPGLYVMYLAYDKLTDERLVWVNGSVELGDLKPTWYVRYPPYGKRPRP